MPKECKRYNNLGECVEWLNVGDKKVIQFKEEAKKCNPKFYEEWKEITDKRKIKVMGE